MDEGLIIRKKVKDLIIGDVLEATKGRIVEGPFDQVRTPKGKTNIVVEYPSGNRRQYIWNKDTVVRLEELQVRSQGQLDL